MKEQLCAASYVTSSIHMLAAKLSKKVATEHVGSAATPQATSQQPKLKRAKIESEGEWAC